MLPRCSAYADTGASCEDRLELVGERDEPMVEPGPGAAAAPAFICTARPRGAASTRSARGAASVTVRSLLPPSTSYIRSGR